MVGTVREVHPAVRRLAESLGLSPSEVLEPAWGRCQTTPECLSLENILESERSGGLSAAAGAHVKVCQRCAALWGAIRV
jgi:hypothetical protein